MKPPKPLHYLLLFLLICTPLFAEQTDAEKKDAAKKEKAEKKKKNSEKKQQAAEEKAIKEQFSYSFNDIRDHLVIIEHETGTGSGFVAKMGEHYYIFTNQHVIFGANKISFTTISGKKLRPKKVELSAERDIARLLLDSDEGLVVSSQIKMDAPVGVFGNSDGAGVATELYGKINGIGGELIEVSALFVAGNSGSPVLNLDQEVIGIASYVRFSSNNRTKKGTQFENKTRRFCYRLADTKWIPVNWTKYNKKYGTFYFKNQQLIQCLENIYSDWKNDLSVMVSLNTESDRRMLSWSQTHNDMIQKHQNKGKFAAEYSKSLTKLSSLCKNESNRTKRFLTEEDQQLTGFLRDEFKRQSNTLSSYQKLCDYVCKLVHP